MADKKVVLITGVAGYWGARLARRLVSGGDYHVIGLDVEPPQQEIEELDFVRADIRNPLLVDLFKAEGVDTVCHLAFVETARPQESAFDWNVMGGTKLLSACAEARVRKVLLKSSTTVYGARPSNSAFLREGQSLRGSKQNGTTRDLVEIETFCAGFRHQASDLVLTILRFPSIVGPEADTPMTRFLADPAAPSLLGFDPLMQLIHEDDVVEALAYVVDNDAPGIFNVAAEDALPLNKIRGLAGKPSLAAFHLAAYWGRKMLGGNGSILDHYLPIELDYLRYTWVADLTKMRDELGFAPRYTAEESLREFAERHRLHRYEGGPATLARDEERLREIMTQRGQSRAQAAATTSEVEEGDDD